MSQGDGGGVLSAGSVRRDRWLICALMGVAYAIRLITVLRSGGLASFGRYDDTVYYTAADALSFGRAPYRHFTLLHPPLLMVVLVPFALLGRLTRDVVGLETARLAFMGIGAINTALVATICRRWGATAMVIGGLMYACWYPAAYSEELTLLEPLGGLFVLIALWLLLRLDRAPSARAEWIAGISLGLAECTKIWYVAPWAVLVVWLLLARRPRSAVRLVGGGIAALVVVVTPFAIAARGRIYDLVIRDQLFRPPAATSRIKRLPNLLGVDGFAKHDPALGSLLVFLTAAVVAVLLLACLRDRRTWPVLAMLAVDVGVLLAGPVFFRHYITLLAGPLAVLVGVGAQNLRRSTRSARLGLAVPVVVGGALLVSGVAVTNTFAGRRFPASAFESALPTGCIASDDPAVLIELDRLSSDLRSGCAVPVDVSGITYDIKRVGLGGEHTNRLLNPAWHIYLYRYLTSARAFMIVRSYLDGLVPAERPAYLSHPVLARTAHLRLRAGNWLGPIRRFDFRPVHRVHRVGRPRPRPRARAEHRARSH